MKSELETQLVVLGGGPGGYAAAFRAADLGVRTLIVEREPTLGGVCLNVGCIPSKALLHVAEVVEQSKQLSEHGVRFGPASIDLERLRAWKSGVVRKMTSNLAGLAKSRKVEVVRGIGAFTGTHELTVKTASEGANDGANVTVRFENAVIAAGSEAVTPAMVLSTAIAAGLADTGAGGAVQNLDAHPRLVDSTGVLDLPFLPERMLVIGGGIIGLEMATVYSSLGARIDVVEKGPELLPGTDRDLVAAWYRLNKARFGRVLVNSAVSKLELADKEVKVWFSGADAPTAHEQYDLVLVAVGRTPNGFKIGASNAGVRVSERGFVEVDPQLRTSARHIFAVGDIVGQPLLAHKAQHQGRVAAEAVAGHAAFFDAQVIPAVAYTNPEIAWVGLTEAECKKQGRRVKRAAFPWAASGRAATTGRGEGLTKLLIDEESERIVGGGIVGSHAGELISELALAIEVGCTATDLALTIHPHPTLSESLGLAAEVHLGSSVDLLNAAHPR
ncbi:MAG TPA: dihydrolipoyl dehydrogenase [Polyangiaceae bacterium]|nr:dihydrolipoyl dehydrogenase [Polyangiaceae bacterium]